MKQIYNEGRIIGASQYEIYVRQLLSTNPEATPMSEREWLTNTLANNISMILRIPAGTIRGVHDYVLPENSNLCGCATIYGSMFPGEVSLDEDGVWATRVEAYGDTISNTGYRHPVTPGQPEDVPSVVDPSEENPLLMARAMEFLKIRGATLIQPGEWKDIERDDGESTNDDTSAVSDDNDEDLDPVPKPPAKAAVYLEPDLNERPFVRILLTAKTKADIYILITGFVDKIMYKGEMGFPVSGESDRPQDGDFLGPAAYPWTCPIVLMITSEVQEAIQKEQARKNAEFEAELLVLKYRVLYLGTLHIVTWDTPLLDESGDVLLTEDGEYLMAEKTGTVAEMWQEEGEDKIVYYVPWEDDDEEVILTEADEEVWAPKEGTITEMIIEGGIL